MASHRRPQTSSGTPKMHAILFVTQIETTFVLEAPLENHFFCHLWAVKEKQRPADVCGRPQEHPKCMPFCSSHKYKQLLYWRCPLKIISCGTYGLSKKKGVPQTSADVLRDVQHICHFVRHTNRNNFCIGDIPGKPFCVPVLGY